MALDINISVQNLEQVTERMSLLERRLQDKILRQGLNAAVGVVRKEVQANAPVQTGALKRAIRSSTRRYTDGRIVGRVTIGGINKRTGERVWYARLVEGGVKPHEIRPSKGKRALRIKVGSFARSVGGKDVFFKSARHPGFKGRFFIRRAYQSSKDRAVGAFERYVADRVQALITVGQDPVS